MNYDNYELWKNNQRLKEKMDLPEMDSVFVNFRYTAPLPYAIQTVTNYWFGDLNEMASYIKYTLVRSALCDYMHMHEEDCLEINMEDLFASFSEEERLKNQKYEDYWNGICDVLKSENIKYSLGKYIEKFNNEFAYSNEADFEIHIAYGLDNFRELRIEQCSDFWSEDEEQEFLEATDTQNFDAQKLAYYLVENTDW